MNSHSMLDLSTTDVLCYHKVHKKGQSSPGFPKDGLSLDETEFERHLIYLKKNYNILNLKDSDCKVKSDKRKLLLTFDDGTRDIKETILSIIEKHNIPIVVFITTSLIEDNTASCWFIDIWENINRNSELSIKINKKTMFFKIETTFQKYNCYKIIHKILALMNRKEQIGFFLENNLKTNYNKYFLTKEDLIKLSNHPLVTIGFHSNYHLNYRIENLQTIENDIDKMFNFFKSNNILPDLRMFAFCYGMSSQVFLDSPLASRFGLYFTLGFKSMIFNKRKSIISRIDVSGHTLNQLKIKIMLLKILRFFLNIFKFIKRR